MGIVSNRRSVMTLYSDSDLKSHRVRIVLAEKGVPYDLFKVDSAQKNRFEELLELNPYGIVPTLLDRDLALYEPGIITEYLDERFPHPPLMPVYPVARAKARIIMYRFDQDWMPLTHKLSHSANAQERKGVLREIASYLIQLLPVFHSNRYFLGDEFSLVDCCMAPLLWRLPAWGITFSAQDDKILKKYCDRLFERDAFQASLTEAEIEMRRLATDDVMA
jgi:stringent starvation protein A